MTQDQTVRIKTMEDTKMRIVIISDTHITPSGTEFNIKAFNRGIEDIEKIKDVDLFLHLGDLTQSGTLLDYEYAVEQMKKFDPISNAPIKYLIGNHDAKNVGYLLFEELMGERHFEFEDANSYIVGIDSTKPDLGGGVIHHNTIDAVRKRLIIPERENKVKIVCFHHQLIPIPNTGKERSAIDDSGNMLQMLIEAKADLVFNGHRHISNLYALNSTKKDLYIFNAGTLCCNKTRYRELFTYNIIDIDGKKLTFRIIPVFKTSVEQEIHRTIKNYFPREIKPDEKPFCKFIQICNTFFSKDKSNEIFESLIEVINDIEDIDLVIHTGNLTKNSYMEEFKTAKEKLSQIKHPYIAVPGYSDSKPPAWEYWQKYFGTMDPLFENEKIYFQGINSTTPDSKTGFIGRKKLHKFIEKVLNLSHQKIFGVCCFHSLIPTPLSVWKTELIDSGDVLSQFARSQIDLVLNSSPSISFNAKIEHTIFSNGGNLQGIHFGENFVEIDIYRDGLTILTEHNLKTGVKNVIGKYHITILT